jgi:hypothetical protein
VTRLIPLAAMTAVVLVQGCATSTHPAPALFADTNIQAGGKPFTGANAVSALVLSQPGQVAVHGTEIGIEKDAPVIEGHPLTSVVVTQCNLVVVVYMTMPDGRLLRFDGTANVPAEKLVSMAYTATRSERVEVGCDDLGATAFETHGPV